MQIKTLFDFKKNTRTNHLLLIALVIVLMLLLNAIWHSKNELPQGKDTFSHLNKLNIAGKILRGEKHHYYYKYDQTRLYNLIFIVYDYPFFYYYASLLFYLLFFPLLGFKAVYICSAFFSCITIIFTYKSARLLLGRRAGLFAAYICAFAPFNITSSRNFNLEMTLIAAICMSNYFFIRSHFFRNRKFSILTALAASASMLTRATAIIPLAGIFIWFFSKAFTDFKKNKQRAAIQKKNFLLFLLTFLSITIIYYGNPHVFDNHMMRSFAAYKSPLLQSFTAYSGPTDLLYRIQYYAKGIFTQALGGIYIFAAIFFLLLCKAAKLLQKTAFFLLFIPLCLIILIPKNISEELAWILPVMPVIIITLASTLKLKNKALRNIVICCIALFLTLQSTTLSFRQHASLKPLLKQIFTGKILPAQKCPAYKNLFADLTTCKMSGELKLGIIAETAQLHFIPIFFTVADLNRCNWQITELHHAAGHILEDTSNFDYILLVSKKKNISSLTSIYEDKQLMFKKTYTFNSNYFEFSEFIYLFKTKK